MKGEAQAQRFLRLVDLVRYLRRELADAERKLDALLAPVVSANESKEERK